MLYMYTQVKITLINHFEQPLAKLHQIHVHVLILIIKNKINLLISLQSELWSSVKLHYLSGHPLFCVSFQSCGLGLKNPLGVFNKNYYLLTKADCW